MEILFEDKDLLVCIKPIGVTSENGMVQLIREHLNDNSAYVGIIHRLDTAVSGVMVYAKGKPAAAKLSTQIQNGDRVTVFCGEDTIKKVEKLFK